MSPEELDWWRGKGRPQFARRCGFIHAVAVGVGLAILCVNVLLRGALGWAGWWALCASIVVLLGWGLRRGEQQASLLLIAFLPLVVLVGQAAVHARTPEPVYMNLLGFRMVLGFFGLALWTYVFTLAYRAERRPVTNLSDQLGDFLDVGH
jgi:hypothetical protein